MTREMLISVPRPGECWVAVLQDGRPEQVYADQDDAGYAGNVYKGRVVTVEPSIQAVFVDFGIGRNGFLHISDVEPVYYRTKTHPDRPRPPMESIFRRGQEVLVQVIKEGIGTKGATLSTYISIAGRYAVVLPGLDRVGLSRKADDEQRRQLWEVVRQLRLPRGLGLIFRAAAAGRGAAELQRDADFLARLWQVTARRVRERRAPAEIYREGDALRRAVRDTFTSDIDTVRVEDPATFEHVRELLDAVLPGASGRLRLDEGGEPLFHRYGIRDENMHSPVPPPSGPEGAGPTPENAAPNAEGLA